MHPTAMNNGEAFFSAYSRFFAGSPVIVVDIGAQDVNGSLRQVCPREFKYIGVDFQDAKGVDVVLDDPYQLPFEDQSIDIVVSSSCFEHSEMFWLSFLEILRILKPGGLFYFNAPSDGCVHKFPVDCWRFYPDSGRALVTWARRNGFDPALLECYTQVGGEWHDYVAVFVKNAESKSAFSDRILHHKQDFENGVVDGSDVVLNAAGPTQNERKIYARSVKGILGKIFLLKILRSVRELTRNQP